MRGHAQLDQRAVELQQAELKDYTYELLFELYDNKGGVLGLLSLVELHIPRSRPMSSFMISFVPGPDPRDAGVFPCARCAILVHVSVAAVDPHTVVQNLVLLLFLGRQLHQIGRHDVVLDVERRGGCRA